MNSKPWRGKVAVITGASRGIGAGMAERFAAEDLRLALCARGACLLADGEHVLTASVDVTDAASLQRFADAAVERFGHIDLWINNAGLLDPIGPLADVDADAVSAQLRVNVDGVFNGSRAFVRHLRARRRQDSDASGVLVNISSGAARNAYAGWSAYCAGKAAVDRMTECLQLEEAANGLHAFSLAPGIVDTAMQALIRSTPESDFPTVQKFLDVKAAEHFNTPDHVARHLLSMAFEPAARPPQVCCSVPPEHG